jgi:hypothetical protein
MKYPITLFAFFVFGTCAAQINLAWLTKLLQDPGFDSTYLESFNGDLTMSAVAQSTNNNISLKNVLKDEVTFATNLPLNYGLALDYKWLSLGFTSSLGRTPNEEKGLTQLRNFGFGITMRKITFRNFYQTTQGYYLANPGYFNPDFNPQTDAYPHRDDLRSTVYYATLNYLFNHKTFSNNAALFQLERQKKSAGTFVTGATYSYVTYRADSALVPAEYQYLFLGNNFITSLYVNLIGANFGYMHTFVLTKNYKFFYSLGIIPGLSYQHGAAYYGNGQAPANRSALGLHAEGRMTFGYNGDTWYAATSIVGYALAGRIHEVNPYNQGFSFLRFSVGYRFKKFQHNNKQLQKIWL